MGFINQKYGKVCTSGLIRRSLWKNYFLLQ
jgi:hypothetical protein